MVDRLFDEGSNEIDAFVDWTQAKPGLVIKPGQKVISRVYDHGKIISEKTHIAGSIQTKKDFFQNSLLAMKCQESPAHSG